MRPLSVVLVIAALAVAGCGSSSSSSSSSSNAAAAASTAAAKPTQLATAKFALHAGLAFGAFHRYIYKPLKAGEFKSLLKHKLAVVKATAAAYFVVRELKLAQLDAKASPLLSKLTTQLAVLTGGFATALVRLKSGHFNPVEVETADSAIEGIKSAAQGAGATITEGSAAIP